MSVGENEGNGEGKRVRRVESVIYSKEAISIH
jgi:hypothetical protein